MSGKRLITKHLAAGLIPLMTASVLLYVSAGFAQNRVDLDDLSIKGELLNDNRMRLSARDPHKMAERVNYRENFRPEILDGLEVAWPERQPSNTEDANKIDLKPATPGA